MSLDSKQRLRLSFLRGLLDGKYTVKEAAFRLHLSERRVKQLKRSFKECGDISVIHGNKGRKPSNATGAELRSRIIEIRRKPLYKDMNFSHFMEYLGRDFGIKLSYCALYSILTANGFVSKKSSHRRRKRMHRHRERRSCFGELLQADATSYKWFGTSDYFALHGIIDDATSSIISLYMSRNECLQGYLEALRHAIERHGLPMELYTDRSGIFNVNGKSEEFKDIDGNDIRKTQFGKMLGELGINPIFANSPQAKGRVERMWNTLQDRLVIFFEEHGVKTIEQANAALPKYIEEHNLRFSAEPACGHSCFVRLPNGISLNALLAVKYDRITDRCGAFSFMNLKFQVEARENMANRKITFMFSDRIGLKAQIDGKCYPVRQLSFMGSRKSPVPNVAKDLFHKCYMENAHSPNYKEIT